MRCRQTYSVLRAQCYYCCVNRSMHAHTQHFSYSDLAIMSVGVRCVCRAPERFSRHYYEDSRQTVYTPSSVIPRPHFYPSAESSCENTVQTDSPAGDKTAPWIFVDRKSILYKTKRPLKRFTNSATGCGASLSVAYSLINAIQSTGRTSFATKARGGAIGNAMELCSERFALIEGRIVT